MKLVARFAVNFQCWSLAFYNFTLQFNHLNLLPKFSDKFAKKIYKILFYKIAKISMI